MLYFLLIIAAFSVGWKTEDSDSDCASSDRGEEFEGDDLVDEEPQITQILLKKNFEELTVEGELRRKLDHLQLQLPEEYRDDFHATRLAEELDWKDIYQDIPLEMIEKVVKKSSAKLELGKIDTCFLCSEELPIYRLDCCNYSACIMCMDKSAKGSFERRPSLTMGCVNAKICKKDVYMSRSLWNLVPHRNMVLDRISFPCPYIDCPERVNSSGHCAAGHFSCTECKKPPHGKMTCEQAALAERAFEESIQGVESEVHEKTMEAESRPCPKCQVSIDRLDGCNEMVCGITSCKYIFCWGCGEASHGHEFVTTTTCNQESVKRWNEKLAKRRQDLIELKKKVDGIIEIKKYHDIFKKIQLLKPLDDVNIDCSYFYFNEVQKRALLISLLLKRKQEAREFYNIDFESDVKHRVMIAHLPKMVRFLEEKNDMMFAKTFLSSFDISELEQELSKY